MVADGRLLDILRRAHIFGLSLLKMDLRQESTRHAEVLGAITKALDLGDFIEWSEEEKCKWLVRRFYLYKR
jgi:phosphoenolpyruvate carboxylase